MKYRLVIIILLVLSLFMLLAYQYFSFHDGKLHVVVCDVGQGDGIYIRTPNGTDMVVDAGPNEAILDCLSSHMPLWDRTIELAFATHPDADHISGFEYVLQSYRVMQFSTSQKTNNTQVFREIQRLIAEKKIPFRFLFSGDTYKTSDGVEIKDYWPTHQYVDATHTEADTNSFSLVQVLSYGNFKVLLAGDIEKEILDTIFKQGLHVTIFKIPHHGSKTGVDDLTLQKIHAQFVPISVGLHNRYHHPNATVLELLTKYKIPFKQTAQVGNIEVVSDGQSWKLIAER